MSEHIGVSGSWKPITSQWIGIGSSWKLITHEWIGVGGSWKLMYAALTASVPNVSNTVLGSGGSGQVSDSASATVSGGSGNYSYSYTHLSTSSGDTPAIISGAATATPLFRATPSDGVPSTSSWRLTSTDTTYGNSTTADFTVTLRWTTDS